MANAPIYNLRQGGIDVAVWEGDYKGTPTYSVTIQRSYKTDDGYKSTSFLRKSDLLVAARLLEKAYDYICDIKTNKSSNSEEF